jgi:hypothetical protein
MTYSNQTATLGNPRQGTSGGKKIDTWSFSRPHPFDDFAHSPKTEVDVYLLTTESGLMFGLRSKALPPGDWRDSDLERLRVSIKNALEEQDRLRGGITWEPWLEVQTSLSNKSRAYRQHGQECGRQLEVNYRPLLRGVHPTDSARFLTINSNGTVMPFPTPLTPDSEPADTLEIKPGEFLKVGRSDSRTAGDTYAYLPDTPANRMALDQIFKGMETLGARLHALLSPTAVEDSMANIGHSLPGLPLLSDPPVSAAPPAAPRKVRPG